MAIKLLCSRHLPISFGVCSPAALSLRSHTRTCISCCSLRTAPVATSLSSAKHIITGSKQHSLSSILSTGSSGGGTRGSGCTSTTAAVSNASTARSSSTSTASQATLSQERINSDGSLTVAQSFYQQQHAATISSKVSVDKEQQQQQQQQQQSPRKQDYQQQAVRPLGVPAAAPAAPPIDRQQLEQLVHLIQSSKHVTVITGAGCSTESNIPDYRGPSGAYTTGFTPMTHQQFMSKPQNRARYWARSFAGWHEFAHVSFNSAHDGLARLQQMGWVDLIVTQNVDRLHHKGGSSSSRVLELHGTTHRVICMSCGDNSCRHDLQQRLSELNPELAARVRRMTASTTGISNRSAYERALKAGTAADGRRVAGGADAEKVPVMRPDGDVELVDAGVGFQVASCRSCGSQLLKPDVVFFGDSVPRDRVQRALEAAESADLVLVVGSSLMVWSAFRLAKAAKEAGAKIAIVNVGPTRADDLATVKIEALAGEVMMRLASHPCLLLPRAAG